MPIASDVGVVGRQSQSSRQAIGRNDVHDLWQVACDLRPIFRSTLGRRVFRFPLRVVSLLWCGLLLSYKPGKKCLYGIDNCLYLGGPRL